jgi:ferredoxin
MEATFAPDLQSISIFKAAQNRIIFSRIDKNAWQVYNELHHSREIERQIGMGHLVGSKSSLTPLIDRLNRYPIGLVDSDKLRQILNILFAEDEAFVASKFPLTEATIGELAGLTGKPEPELLDILESMANKGLVMDLPYNGVTYYLLMPGLIGFMEFTFMRNRSDLPMKKLAELMTEYLYEQGPDGQAKEFFGSKTQLTRALPYKEHIPTHSQITNYEDARQIIKDASFTAVTQCYCRHKKAHLDQTCKKGAPTEEICMVMGSAARFLVRRGFAVEKNTDEMLTILDTAKSLNLTHVTDNIRNKPSFICNCCHCCCELMGGLQMGFSDGMAKTPFLAEVDKAVCDYCGQCFAACNVKCIALDTNTKGGNKADRKARIDPLACLGCGACISACEKGAIGYVPRKGHKRPPKNKGIMFTKILWEKGRFSAFMTSEMKRKIRKTRRGI